MDIQRNPPQVFTDLYDYIRGPECAPIPGDAIGRLEELARELHGYGFNLLNRLPDLSSINEGTRRPITIDAGAAAERLRPAISPCLEFGIDLLPLLHELTNLEADTGEPNREYLCAKMRLALISAEANRRGAEDADFSDEAMEDLMARLQAG